MWATRDKCKINGKVNHPTLANNGLGWGTLVSYLRTTFFIFFPRRSTKLFGTS
jgi:hypothetical protein